jgi:hypothetical protein
VRGGCSEGYCRCRFGGGFVSSWKLCGCGRRADGCPVGLGGLAGVGVIIRFGGDGRGDDWGGFGLLLLLLGVSGVDNIVDS